ncbi:Helicase conserved C-terminal domain-containing protein [Sulfobacillus thermosulfidooxidans DSM 9293]|uniref:Helicase conserved C-terminal domain-containing protein n=1 Tax=Sulfobacillus thermosulfidooxidans (strain DSM 9293 / VKM B-1269 / AT-1) TaxID=929705 RepID=A0A1W1WHT4_SULTA|nr:DEAD/DEAH box helicase [Sulfobacillus thermosulfidooxidans]SMC05709.1 Helicase conserved C-terminal domain-containing protein [Sulfobacillus thermosulfidooxidans DSM 9293]
MEPFVEKDFFDYVGEHYLRYLRTTFPFRDPEIRHSFEKTLAEDTLIKGPFLESLPRFARGISLTELLHEECPAVRWDSGFLQAVTADRPLYQHQEDAIRNALRQRNTIIATGTGSGKTESFLLPILISLYLEFQRETTHIPGVRAIILYPMNALVADQRERLGTIAERLETTQSRFRFSFGQYIGATPDSSEDRFRQPYSAYPFELVTRKQIQETPPDILITNYSMLEYLLLRPQDSALFDNGRAAFWRFLVLDEAHQYRGAEGMEMAMLLRRLKDRLQQGGASEPFTCIATSASLADGPGRAKEVAEFAQTLFNEPFEARDVIFGTERPLVIQPQSASNPGTYQQRLNQFDELPEHPESIIQALVTDSRFDQFVKILSQGPVTTTDLASQIFPDFTGPERQSHFNSFVQLISLAQDHDGPLFPLRYHFFIRALEGVRITFVEPDYRPQLLLTGISEAPGLSFDLAICQSCGQHYLSGRIVEFRWDLAITDPSHVEYAPEYYLPRTSVLSRSDVGTAMNDLIADTTESDRPILWSLCVICGTAGLQAAPECSHETLIVLQQTAIDENSDRLTCLVCGKHQMNIIRDVLHGADGPHAVIATAIHAKLPPSRRKVLAFSDSRHRAAFFAWYLQDSYETIVRRHHLYDALRHSRLDPDDISLEDAWTVYAKYLQDHRLLSEASSYRSRSRRAWIDVMKELLGDEAPPPLAEVGLLRGTVLLPSWCRLEDVFGPLGLSAELANECTQWILTSLVQDHAVEMPSDEIDWDWGQLDEYKPQSVAVFAPHPTQHGISVIDGPKTKRVETLAKILSHSHDPADWQSAKPLAQKLLRQIFVLIERQQRAQHDIEPLLIVTHEGYRVNLKWWRWSLVNIDDVSACSLWICSDCRHISPVYLDGMCSEYRCRGQMRRLVDGDLADNHYTQLYQEDLPSHLRVEEHTAQLERNKALEFQQEFKEGAIHVLSSSTTFELGVDLGDLNIVFLRNVPPENFNYAQRVGRAGRRAGMPGIALTYCGRSPHDLYHFDHPTRMIRGETSVPVIRIGNEVLVFRHWMAVLLSSYFRVPSHQSQFGTIRQLLNDMNHPQFLDSFRSFIQMNQTELRNMFLRIMPKEVHGHANNLWQDEIFSNNGRLVRAVTETVSDWRMARDTEDAARAKRDYHLADWALKRARGIEQENVLTFLSRKVVIPKYGFPVDVVELELITRSTESHDVTLQRDLTYAISEFAPSSQVIANKKVWTSEALKQVPEISLPQFHYRRCMEHGILQRVPKGQTFWQSPCCAQMECFDYIIPVFGFVSYKEPQNPTRRLDRIFSTRPYLVNDINEKDNAILEQDTLDDLPFIVHRVTPGRIVVISEGKRSQGFYICPECGMASTKMVRKPHKTHWGRVCTGKALTPVALGHEFMTDILRIEFPQYHSSSVATAFGVAYAIQYAAAQILDIPMSDINALGDRFNPMSIVLYDNVPGGAGFVTQLEHTDAFMACLKVAMERVNGSCGCDEQSSCYGCLRTYNNQFIHHQLHRGNVYQILREIYQDAGHFQV